jgi:D-alanyl-D-alanine carboxypeptidase
MNPKVIISIFFFFFSVISLAQVPDIVKIDSFIHHIETNDRGIGSISIFMNGKEIYNKSFGQSRLNNVKFDQHTRYQIGSITKTVTATLIFELIENNKLRLDDKLALFFPTIPNAEKITIKNLLEHSSGLRDFVTKNDSISWLTEKVNDNDILEEIIRQGCAFKAGEKVEYSNSGYFLLAKIAEKLFNEKYARLVSEKIGKPLQLEDFSSSTELTDNRFKSYQFTEKWEKMKDLEFSNVTGVGDISSTTKDLNLFLYYLLNNQIVKKEYVEQMKPTNKEIFGRGLMLIPYYHTVFWGHGGDTYGTHSVVAYTEKGKLGIAISLNGERFPINDLAIGVLNIIYNKQYEFPEFSTKTFNPEDLDVFTGVYSSPTFPLKLRISKDGNSLQGQAVGQSAFPLERVADNIFRFDDAFLKIEFKPVEKKLILHQSNKVFVLTKE